MPRETEKDYETREVEVTRYVCTECGTTGTSELDFEVAYAGIHPNTSGLYDQRRSGEWEWEADAEAVFCSACFNERFETGGVVQGLGYVAKPIPTLAALVVGGVWGGVYDRAEAALVGAMLSLYALMVGLFCVGVGAGIGGDVGGAVAIVLFMVIGTASMMWAYTPRGG